MHVWMEHYFANVHSDSAIIDRYLVINSSEVDPASPTLILVSNLILQFLVLTLDLTLILA